MKIKLVTLAYSEGLSGFPQDAVDQACATGHLLEVRDHFFLRAGVPHLALILVLDDADGAPARTRSWSRDEDPGTKLPEALQPLYGILRQWRNERARAEKIPAYSVLRNAQLVEICRRLPRSQAELREIDGIGEGTCSKYAREILALIPADLARPGEEPLGDNKDKPTP